MRMSPAGMQHAQTRISQSFTERAAAAVADTRLGRAVVKATLGRCERRIKILSELPDSQAAFDLAARIKDHTLENLDRYLNLFVANVARNGGQVHFATSGEQACAIIAEIARAEGARLIVKAKSMVSEEVHLTPSLEAKGFEVLETDLGEFVVQQDHDRPSHIVAPVIHKTVSEIARLFERILGIAYTEDPEALTMAARRHLREKFRTADLGICGCNFAVAETGTVCIATNEGNGALSTSRPRAVVVLMGLEKLVPSMGDLAVMLKLLAKSGTGIRATVYTSLLTGPRRTGDADGPEAFHVVILDGGRTRILASEYRDALRCIRCGACLNFCPVYRVIGGHAYNSVYPGPIGQIITPLLQGFSGYEDFPNASSLCGACYEACPVRIDIPRFLIRMRQVLRRQGDMPFLWRLGFRLWRGVMGSSLLYRVGRRLARRGLRRVETDGWYRRLPGPLGGWTEHRDFPAMADRPFSGMWRELP